MKTYPALRQALQTWWNSTWEYWTRACTVDRLEQIRKTGQLSDEFAVVPLELETWDSVARVVADDPDLSQQLGHKIGSVLWQTKITVNELAAEFCSHAYVLICKAQNYPSTPPEESFERIYGGIEEFLGSDHIHYTAIAPILGLQLEHVPIHLSQDVYIDEISPATDGSTLGEFGVLEIAYREATRGLEGDELPRHLRHAFHSRFALPKLIDGEYSPDQSRERAAAIYQQIESQRRNCVRAIAACTFSRILPWSSRITEDGWRHGKGSIGLRVPYLALRMNSPGSMIFAASEGALRLAWQHVSESTFDKKNAAVRVVLDRLVGLGSRTSAEDQLVDALIACESFFTLGSPSRAELAFRASINAASVSALIQFPMAQGEVLALMQRAYDLRSKIVHGDEIREKDRRLSGIATDLDTWTYYAAELARRGVLWAFSRHEPGTRIDVDWPRYYFGQGT